MVITRIAERLRSEDRGLGLVEIVVAMFLLALLALSLAPLLIQGMRATARNATLAAATQLASERIALAQAEGPVCADVLATAGVRDLTDARGVDLRATTVTGSCPAGGTGTVSVSVTVARLDTGETVADAATLVFVAP